MLALAPSRNTKNEGDKTQSFSIGGGSGDDFLDFSGDNLLEVIDFGDLFDGMEYEDVLPDLEMDPEILAEFSVSVGDDFGKIDENLRNKNQEEENQVSGSGNRSGSSCLTQGEEIGSKRDESVAAKSSAKEAGKERKSSKNHQGKRKVKVDWTPELHRRFVQAVEQLGVDKAVPSRILELMGIDCLTRHNIASHLQKYRSHRKHMLAREAEAASWTQRRQMSVAATRGGCKREMTSPWVAPTIGFTPVAPMSHFRPLHVWGHPSMDQSLMHVWPKHLAPSQSPPPHIWPPVGPSPHLPQPPMDPSFWHSRHQRVPNSLTPGTPCFPPPSLAPTRFTAPPVHGIPPHAMYKVDPSAGVPTAPAGQTCLHPPDFHPSKESVDAAIGDALSKPWLPLPLGLKPPSSDSVVVELHRQGIEKFPPTCA